MRRRLAALCGCLLLAAAGARAEDLHYGVISAEESSGPMRLQGADELPVTRCTSELWVDLVVVGHVVAVRAAGRRGEVWRRVARADPQA